MEGNSGWQWLSAPLQVGPPWLPSYHVFLTSDYAIPAREHVVGGRSASGPTRKGWSTMILRHEKRHCKQYITGFRWLRASVQVFSQRRRNSSTPLQRMARRCKSVRASMRGANSWAWQPKSNLETPLRRLCSLPRFCPHGRGEDDRASTYWSRPRGRAAGTGRRRGGLAETGMHRVILWARGARSWPTSQCSSSRRCRDRGSAGRRRRGERGVFPFPRASPWPACGRDS